MSKSEINNSALEDIPDADNAQHPMPRAKKGWAGEEMEMNHQRDYLKQQTKSISGGAAAPTFAAVDLNQFRNTEVGHGYQAKGVVRQKSMTHADTIDGKNGLVMKKDVIRKSDTCCSSTGEEGRDVDKGLHRKRKRRGEQVEHSKSSLTDKYLQSEGIRNFRRELKKV